MNKRPSITDLLKEQIQAYSEARIEWAGCTHEEAIWRFDALKCAEHEMLETLSELQMVIDDIGQLADRAESIRDGR